MTTKIDETSEVEWIRYQGDSLSIEISEVDSNNSPIDYTGYVVRFAVGTINESTSGVTATHTGASGTISIFVPDDVMDDLIVNEYDVAVEVYNSTTKTRRTLFTGTLVLIEDVRT